MGPGLPRHRRSKVGVTKGRPPLDVTLFQIAQAWGDLTAAAAVLSVRYPVTGEPAVALGHLRYALLTCRRRYRTEVPPKPQTVGGSGRSAGRRGCRLS